MSKILITGNGFDLFHHLPTKYGHFMAIMETIEKYDFQKEVKFEDLFERFFKERFPRDYKSIEDNYFIEKIFFEREKTLRISKLLESNAWYKHFKNVNYIDTWIDFETEIENVLLSITKLFISSIEDKSNKNVYVKKHLNIYEDLTVFEFCINRNDVVLKINENFIDIKSKNINEKKVLGYLSDTLNDFKNIFSSYLTDIVYLFYDFFKFKPIIPIEKISKVYTFNYTPSLQKFYKFEESQIVYLHGNQEKMVLGVSEIPELIKANKFYHFTKYYQKIINKVNPKFIKIPEKIDETNLETIFYLFGHSLDKSDEKYLTDLFNFLKKDLNKTSKICVFYYDDKDHESKLNNILSIIDNELVDEMHKNERFYFVELNEFSITFEFSRKLILNNNFKTSIR